MDKRFQTKKEKKITITTLLFSLLLVLAACSSNQVAEAQGVTTTGDGTVDGFSEPKGSVPVSGDESDGSNVVVDIEKDTTKSEEELIQEELAQIIADGTYEEERTYAYHAGTETVTISITVEQDIVTAASITESPDAHSVSSKYINGVNDALGDLVVGKRIDELDIPERVSGSSLTTAAFKTYVDDLIETY